MTVTDRSGANRRSEFDRVVRAETGAPLLDNDGEPITELHISQVDRLAEQQAAVAELAARQRAWRYGHVIVDEAQDLTPMQWRMLVRRARDRSMTIVGDLAQRTLGPAGRWEDHLPPELGDVSHRELTVNYRSPAEVNEVASALLRTLAPDLTPSAAIRSTGEAPTVMEVGDAVGELETIVRAEVERSPGSRLAVIGMDLPDLSGLAVHALTPVESKGLEFDSVVLVEPASILEGTHGLSDLYVAVTRTTQRLTVVHQRALPDVLASALT
ncbi:MAG: UvrD-helicase domain-containing protein [Actinomycetota bacterium]